MHLVHIWLWCFSFHVFYNPESCRECSYLANWLFNGHVELSPMSSMNVRLIAWRTFISTLPVCSEEATILLFFKMFLLHFYLFVWCVHVCAEVRRGSQILWICSYVVMCIYTRIQIYLAMAEHQSAPNL